MKDQNLLFIDAEVTHHASQAVKQINDTVEKVFPTLSVSKKIKLVMECLIELTEETRYLRAQ